MDGNYNWSKLLFTGFSIVTKAVNEMRYSVLGIDVTDHANRILLWSHLDIEEQ